MVAEPAKPKELTEPRVLVRRNMPDLEDARGNQVISLPGYPAISLFTGIGGFDIGLERAGFVTCVQHEWDAMCCQTLLANRPDFFRHAALIQGDIRDTPTSMILREGGLRVGEATIATGGPPCQGFSTSNSGRGKKHDPRNDLVFQFLRVVHEAQPNFWIFENVPGFMELNKGAYFERFLEQAHSGYYELVYGLVDCVEYGVPQYRCRFICMATRRDLFEIDGKLGGLPSPHCFDDKDLAAIRSMEGGPLFADELALRTHAPGIRYFPDRPILRPPRPIHSDGGRTKRFIEFYRQIERDEPDRIVREPWHGKDQP